MAALQDLDSEERHAGPRSEVAERPLAEEPKKRWDSGRILVWILIVAMVAIPLATRFGYLPHVNDPGICYRSGCHGG